MNDAWGYDDSNSESGHNDGPETPKALRDAYAALKKQNEDLISSLNADRAERAKEKVSSVFSELGIPDAAKLYQGEPDPAKAREWAETMKATFGGTQGVTPTLAETAPALTPEQQAQLQTMNEAGQTGVPMGNIQAAEAALGSATSIEDLIRLSAQTQHLRG